MPDVLSIDTKVQSVAKAEAKQATDRLQVEKLPILFGTIYKRGTVPPGYLNPNVPAGQHSGTGTIDLDIGGRVYYDVPFTASPDASKGNEFASGTRFQVEFPRSIGNFEPAPDVSKQLKASKIPDPRVDDIESEVARPTSFGHDLAEVFKLNTNQSFTELSEEVQRNCPTVPKNLADAIDRMKRRATEKLVVLPNALNIRDNRISKAGQPKKITDNPKIEVTGGFSPTIRITSGANAGIAFDHGDIILSGKISMNDSSPSKKHQGTGIEMEPMDNPLIQGPIVAPHPKGKPKLGWIDAIVPLALGVKMLKELVVLAKEL